MPGKGYSSHIGLFLLAAGVLIAPWILEATVFPVDYLFGNTPRLSVVFGSQAVVVGLAVWLLLRRPLFTAVQAAALSLGALMAVSIGAVFLQVAYVPAPVMSGWRAFAPASERNQLEFRGRDIVYAPDDEVIVLLGDSQVEAIGLAFEHMPERALERYLSVPGKPARVFSVGAGAYGTDQELLALEEYFGRYRADVVVLWQTPTNDIWNNLFNTHMASRNPKPTFWLDATGNLQGPTESPGQPLTGSRITLFAVLEHVFGLPWREKEWERSLPEPYRPLGQYEGPVQMEWEQRWENNAGRMRDEQLDTEKSHLAVLLTPRSKRMEYALRLTRALTHRIESLVRQQGGQLVIIQAVPPQPASTPDEAVYRLHGKYYRVSKRQASMNWECVNMGFRTEMIPVTLRNWRMSVEDAHLNQQATEQVMRDLAIQLRSGVFQPQRGDVNR